MNREERHELKFKIKAKIKKAAEALRKNPRLGKEEYKKALEELKRDMSEEEYKEFITLVKNIKQCPHCGSFDTGQMCQYNHSDYRCFSCNRWFTTAPLS